jgi:hypothetical protein
MARKTILPAVVEHDANLCPLFLGDVPSGHSDTRSRPRNERGCGPRRAPHRGRRGTSKRSTLRLSTITGGVGRASRRQAADRIAALPDSSQPSKDEGKTEERHICCLFAHRSLSVCATGVGESPCLRTIRPFACSHTTSSVRGDVTPAPGRRPSSRPGLAARGRSLRSPSSASDPRGTARPLAT